MALTTAQTKAARLALRERLLAWGFTPREATEVVRTVTDLIRSGANSAQKMQAVRDTNAYKTRFAGITALEELNDRRVSQGLAPLNIPNEAEYVQAETDMVNVMRRAGLPAGFYDSRDDIGKFIGAGMSVSELSERVSGGILKARNANPELRQELERLYGVAEGDIAAYFLNEKKTVDLLTKQMQAAEIGSYARTTGFGQVSAAELEKLAGQGVTGARAQEGFADLSRDRSLFRDLSGEAIVSEDEALAATFQGDAAARSKIERVREARKGEVEGSRGGALTSGGGVVGLGSATN